MMSENHPAVSYKLQQLEKENETLRDALKAEQVKSMRRMEDIEALQRQLEEERETAKRRMEELQIAVHQRERRKRNVVDL
jgi:chromosome segregation ATPase